MFEKAFDGFVGANYTPVMLEATQVVAGTNYKFKADGTKTTDPLIQGTYYVYINKDLQGNISLLDIEVIEEHELKKFEPDVKLDTELKKDVTQTSFWVVFYDQYGNELQREVLKYGSIPSYKKDLPEGFEKWVYKNSQKDVGTFKAITGNTYYQAICHAVSCSSNPTPGPMQELTVEQILRTISGGFPIKTDTSFPENAWKNGNDIKCFILPTDGNEVLEFADGKMANEKVGLSTVTTIDGTNYKTTGEKDGIITFIMKNGILISIEVSGETWISSIINGSFISTSRPDGFVDLGVTNSSGNPLYWAKCNLGASNPQDSGDYYMWGATAKIYSTVDYSKTEGEGAFTIVDSNPYGDKYMNSWDKTQGFDWVNTLFIQGVYNDSNKNVFTKYTTNVQYAKSGSPDNINTLKPEDDVATVTNSSWRIPTKDDFAKLGANCVWMWIADYNSTGKSGYIVYKAKSDDDKGKVYMNGNWKMWDSSDLKFVDNTGTEPTGYTTDDTHIFLSVTGSGSNGSKLYSYSIMGSYWTSNFSDKNEYAYYFMLHNSDIQLLDNSVRYRDNCIRPVAE